MKRSLFRLSLVLAVLLGWRATSVLAQTGPTIELTVDARQAPERIIRTRMVIPAKPGPLTLYYPKWIPGEHRPDGPIANVAGLKFTGNGKTIPWTRDLLDVFTFHLDVPEGVSQLSVSFQYLEPSGMGGHYTAGVSSTDKLVDISWNQNLLYLAGIRAQQQTFHATLVLPKGWKFGTALPVENQEGNRIAFQPVALNRLVDSPVIAGEYFRAINLTPLGEPIHHEIDMVADSPEALDMSPALVNGLTNLVAETGRLFGARHYRDYHFLLTLSNYASHFGLEHHESDDSRLPERTLLSPNASVVVGGLLAHEFVHSWNGKFRRPADMSTPYYEVPEKTDMLWVYEGLTDYLGHVLATRSSLWTQNNYHRYLADTAAELGPGRPGRMWQSLLDDSVAAPKLSMFGPRGGMGWRRGVADYHSEGDFLWLEVATVIHQQSHGKKSFGDFCKLFYGGPNDGPQLKSYTIDQLVHALNEIVPYDWPKFFRERLDSTSPEVPMGGVKASGWKVTYSNRPSRIPELRSRGAVSAAYSIGLTVAKDGTVLNSIWNAPAFRAGLTPGMKVAAVNGRAYTPELIEDAIEASKTNTEPIRLLVVNDDYYKTCTIDYHGGERYPHLVREPNAPDYLDSGILQARAPHE